MNKQQPTCIPCGIQRFRRNTYFNGKLLVERDFEAEQAYFVGKDRMHNSLLHGTGTVCGLKVLAHPSPDCRDKFVYVTPGTAVDCCGRDIIITENTLIPIHDLIKDQEVEVEPDGTKDLFISLCYEESLTEKIPVILPDCDCADANEAFNRIQEGFSVRLFSEDKDKRKGARPPLRAKLDWQHSLILPNQSPRALVIDEQKQQVYVGIQNLPVDGELPAELHAYRMDNNDLVVSGLIAGGTDPTDLAVSLLGDRIYMAMTYAAPAEDGGDPADPEPVVAVFKEAGIRSSVQPAKTISLDGPARLAVSPATGALFALELDDGSEASPKAVLKSWTDESIKKWLDAEEDEPSPKELEFDSTFANLAGASMLNVTLNGRYLFIVDAGGGVVRVVDVAEFNDITPLIDSEGDPVAVFTSRDSEYLYVLWHKTAPVDGKDVDHARLTRYAIVASEGSVDLVLDGSGGEWPAMPVDLAISPDERWAYVLEIVDDQGWVQTVSINEIASPADPDPETLLGTHEKVSGQVVYQQLAVRSGLLYVAAEDKETPAQPERGLIAVLDVEEAACDAIFTKTLDGCPPCPEEGDKAGRCVVLAHIPKYHSEKGFHDPGKSPDGDNEIDNLTYRPMLPSTQNITEVIRCMLEQGIAEGIPGPRGPAGEQGLQGEAGARGPGITDAVVTTLEPGSSATAGLIPIPDDPEGDFLLNLGIPAGADGENGIRGPGIVEVQVTTLPPGSSATASLQPITGDPEGDQRLRLGIPQGQPGVPGPIDDPELTHITNLSWRHGRPMSLDKFVEPGLVIAFDGSINTATIADLETKQSEIFQLYARSINPHTGSLCECIVPGAICEPVQVDAVSDNIISAVTPMPGAQESKAMRLLFERERLPTILPPNHTIDFGTYQLGEYDNPLEEQNTRFEVFDEPNLPAGHTIIDQVGILHGLFSSAEIQIHLPEPAYIVRLMMVRRSPAEVTIIVENKSGDSVSTAMTGIQDHAETLVLQLADIILVRITSEKHDAYLLKFEVVSYPHFKVIFRSDFALDMNKKAVDGNHIGGLVPDRPTGNGRQGGTFESWFTVILEPEG